MAILPNMDYTVHDVVNDFSAENWASWTDALVSTEEIKINFPKFEIGYNKTLNDVLKELGMGTAFADADFSNINGRKDLQIDEVVHQSFIKVDEVGTEAAAVTAILFEGLSAPTTPVLIFNRPFVFVIRDNASNSVLFVGKIMNPNE